MPFDYSTENEIEKFEEETAREISRKCKEFIFLMRDEYDADVLGIGEKVRGKFLNLKSFEDYNIKEKFKNYDIEIETKFKIRHSGIIYKKERK